VVKDKENVYKESDLFEYKQKQKQNKYNHGEITVRVYSVFFDRVISMLFLCQGSGWWDIDVWSFAIISMALCCFRDTISAVCYNRDDTMVYEANRRCY